MQDLPLDEAIERINTRRRAALENGRSGERGARVTDNISTIAPQDLIITSDSVKDDPMQEVREKMAENWQDLFTDGICLEIREKAHAKAMVKLVDIKVKIQATKDRIVRTVKEEIYWNERP